MLAKGIYNASLCAFHVTRRPNFCSRSDGSCSLNPADRQNAITCSAMTSSSLSLPCPDVVGGDTPTGTGLFGGLATAAAVAAEAASLLLRVSAALWCAEAALSPCPPNAPATPFWVNARRAGRGMSAAEGIAVELLLVVMVTPPPPPVETLLLLLLLPLSRGVSSDDMILWMWIMDAEFFLENFPPQNELFEIRKTKSKNTPFTPGHFIFISCKSFSWSASALPCLNMDEVTLPQKSRSRTRRCAPCGCLGSENEGSCVNKNECKRRDEVRGSTRDSNTPSRCDPTAT